MYPTLPHPVTVVSTEQKTNLFTCFYVEEIVNGGRYLNEYVYVRAGAACTINRGCCLQGDHPGAVRQVFQAQHVPIQFMGVNRVAFADDDYGFILRRGAIDLSLAAGALRSLRLTDATGVLAAQTMATITDNDVGMVLDDGTAIIGMATGMSYT